MPFDYIQKTRAWGSKFLPNYLDASLLARRELGSFATTFAVKRIEVQNRSGQTCNIGYGGRLPADSTLWKAGAYVTGSPGTYTDDTADAQSSAASDFALSTTTNNDGFIVLCQIPFNVLSALVGQAANGSPVWDIEYSKAGGTWTSIGANALSLPVYNTTAEHVAWWEIPLDWGVSEAGHATGIPTGYYAIRIRATTAPTVTAALATTLIPGIIVQAVENVADNQYAFWNYNEEVILPPQCDGLAVVMAGANIPNAQNIVSYQYRLRG